LKIDVTKKVVAAAALQFLRRVISSVVGCKRAKQPELDSAVADDDGDEVLAVGRVVVVVVGLSVPEQQSVRLLGDYGHLNRLLAVLAVCEQSPRQLNETTGRRVLDRRRHRLTHVCMYTTTDDAASADIRARLHIISTYSLTLQQTASITERDNRLALYFGQFMGLGLLSGYLATSYSCSATPIPYKGDES